MVSEYKDKKEEIISLFDDCAKRISDNLLKIAIKRTKDWAQNEISNLQNKANMLEKKHKSCPAKIKISYYHLIGNMERSATVPVDDEIFTEEIIKKYFSKLPPLRKTSQLLNLEYEISKLQKELSQEIEKLPEFVDEILSESKNFLLNADDSRPIDNGLLAVVAAAIFWACRKKKMALDRDEVITVFAGKISEQDLIDELFLAKQDGYEVLRNSTGL